MSTLLSIVWYAIFFTLICICRGQAVLDEPIIFEEVIPRPAPDTVSLPVEKGVAAGADDAISMVQKTKMMSFLVSSTVLEKASGAASDGNLLQSAQRVSPSEKTPIQ